MNTIVGMAGRPQAEVHSMNAGTHGIDEENLALYFPEHGNLSLEEILQDQESVYLSFQAYNQNLAANTSVNNTSNLSHEQSGDQLQIAGKEGESSVSNAMSQLELDEALAISLQELENQLGSTSLDGNSETEAVDAAANSAETSTQAAGQDNVDPDNMTYEELQSLGEEIGTESKGLSEEVIKYLPSSKYKTGFFKKGKHEECVICYMEYKNREWLTKLPCKHQYHRECVTKWLMLNKTCPVCNEEVFGS